MQLNLLEAGEAEGRFFCFRPAVKQKNRPPASRPLHKLNKYRLFAPEYTFLI